MKTVDGDRLARTAFRTLYFHERCDPLFTVFVLPIELVDVDANRSAVLHDREAIHVPSRPAALCDVLAIGLKLRVMLPARERVVMLVPFERSVLVWAREIERVHSSFPSHQNHAVRLVDLRAVGERERIGVYRVGRAPGFGKCHRHRERVRFAHTHGDECTSYTEEAVAQKATAVYRNETVMLLAILSSGWFVGHWRSLRRPGIERKSEPVRVVCTQV